MSRSRTVMIRYTGMKFIRDSRSLLKPIPSILIKHRLFDPSAAIAGRHVIVAEAAERHFDVDGQLHRLLDGFRPRIRALPGVHRTIKAFDEITPLIDPDTDRCPTIGHSGYHTALQVNAVGLEGWQ